MKEFRYVQATGRFFLVDEAEPEKAETFGRGYSGHPPYVNDTESEALVARGPIPRGGYRLHGPFNSQRLGPCVFWLEPHAKNSMFGRSGFFIHGDNDSGNRSASHGCIILSRSVRDRIARSGARSLAVI